MDSPTLASAFREGTPLLGAWSMTAQPVVLEVLAGEGFDFLVVDGEHSENTIADLAMGVRTIDAVDTATDSVVRVSGPDRAEIRRVLDFGPAGIVIPQIESAEAAQRAVEATAYPPDGVRGVAGGRASGYGTDLSKAVATANESVATILQIETEGALEDVETIVEIDGLDAVFVGPADLSARLGAFGDFDAEPFREAIDRIVAAARGADVPVGTLATGIDTIEARWNEWDVDFLVAGTDVGYLRRGAAAYLDRFDRSKTR
ncbi:HpcH/HpaI aldolase/citrate lyase family protein [Halanaeroarchaeum sp. HSR-CO]|uniref:HpcH/HpaI aldolase family protein n=1 Tax=Halanaeroarchaeum sp. HSR-CO TaxID=2866382 RepID=UPI00217DE81C|nr:aldolase/citrate lyase family protein [Halanaeroarchaeum sp. HSR-CO]